MDNRLSAIGKLDRDTVNAMALALLDTLDGIADWRELQHCSGLSRERCEAILAIYKSAQLAISK